LPLEPRAALVLPLSQRRRTAVMNVPYSRAGGRGTGTDRPAFAESLD